MREAIGAILPLAVGVALSPVPVIAVVLLLATLSGLRDWMGRHDAAIMSVLLRVIGAKLIGDGVATV